MSRTEYSWQVALQQSLLPLPRCTQPTRTSIFNLSAIHRPVLALCGTVHGSSTSLYTLSSVSRSAGSHSLNLRGQRLHSVVPANGCLATLLMRWSCLRVEDSSLRKSFTRRENTFRQVKGNLRFPLTITYHRCPASSSRIVRVH